MSLEQDLESARALFVAHRNACVLCRRYDYTSSTLPFLCYEGTIKLKNLLKFEDAYVKNTKPKRVKRKDAPQMDWA